MISAGMDGFKRLEEINSSVEKESNKTILELIFLPLYGNISHKEIAESVLEYDLQLCKANNISEMIFAATLNMSNNILAVKL
jgi:hypothetical protein